MKIMLKMRDGERETRRRRPGAANPRCRAERRRVGRADRGNRCGLDLGERSRGRAEERACHVKRLWDRDKEWAWPLLPNKPDA